MFMRFIIASLAFALIMLTVPGCKEKGGNTNNASASVNYSDSTEKQAGIPADNNTEAVNNQGTVENNEKTVKAEPEKQTSESGQNKTVVKTVGTDYNVKYSWSFVRKKDHLPPAFEKKSAELADKYDAIYLADTSKKEIYLTFDEGYENGYTSKILDTLKENNVKAAFFITMPYLKTQYELVDRMVKEGHTVGNHTVHHPSLPEVTDDKELEEELLGLDTLFKEKTGQSMKYLRPPKGEFSERTLKISKDLGYRNVFWSMAYADWDVNNQKGADYAHRMVVDNIHNGAVILLHAVSKDNAEALDGIIKELKAQGYTFGTLDNLK